MDRRRLLIITAALPAAAVLPQTRAAWANGDPPPGDTQPPPGPPVTVTVEPIEGPDAVYLPLAPATANDVEAAKLILRLRLTNVSASDLTISQISFSFPGSGIPAKVMQGVDLVLGDGGVLAAGQAKWWSNGSVTLANNTDVKNQVYLDLPVPATVRVNIFALGYQSATSVTLPLTPYQIGHKLPLDLNDLRPAECLSAIGDHWANGGAPGPQIYAHDVGVLGWDDNANAWHAVLPAAVGKSNAQLTPQDFRAWDLPIRAVADGTVLDAADGMDDNTVIGQLPNPTPSPVGGNYVWLSHADGTRTYYTHMRKGSLTVAIGQTVTAGQILGHLGNSGNTSGPHIHVEVRKYISTNPLRPWVLREAWLVERAANTPWDPQSPLWVNADGLGIPNKEVLIWPSSIPPKWYRPGYHEWLEYEWPPHHWNELLRRAQMCGYEPVALSPYQVGADTRFCAVFRPAGRDEVRAGFCLSGAEFLAESESLRREGFRPVSLASHVDRDVRYTAIWSREAGPEWTMYQGIGVDEHQRQLETLTAQGLRPVNVSVVAPDDRPQVCAFYVQEKAGSFAAPSLLTGTELERAVAEHAREGRQLTHLNAVGIAGEPRFSAVFLQTATDGDTRFKHGLTSAELFTELDNVRNTGYYTQALAGYELDGRAAFTASWHQGS
jgi:Peptidase family M23/Polyglycine hydrolase-like, structural repeat